MSSIATQPFSGTFVAQPAPSTFALAVCHSGVFWYRGPSADVSASGRFAPPPDATFGEVAGLQLATTLDRRDFGFDWQAQLPGGGDAVSWDVNVEIDLLLMRAN